ncbi:MAG TPA: YhbY family RNA-binding protein, partial [Burkholderiales bacterium]|nr:YhbY family RNA-binding protein [Burkholderiales bacterium]
MKELDPAERRALRARAHSLHPVVTIGNAGLKPEVIAEIEAHLKVHELMKIRARGDEREAR